MAKIGPYDVVSRIAIGGMAEVFLARRVSEGMEKQVVVKRILPQLAAQPEFVAAFLNEARISSRLDHPNITQVIELVKIEDSYCLVMEFVDGPNLDKLIEAATARGQKLPVAHVVKIIALACDALGYAHRMRDDAGNPLGFVHRDVSPDNLLLSYGGALKVADFGIAKVRSIPSITRAGVLKGKPHYAAPEHIRGIAIDARADLYGLGVVLFQALTGTRPFDAPTPIELMRKVMLEEPPEVLSLRPELPASVAAIVTRAMQKEPDARYPDARTMQGDLDRVLADLRQPVGGADLADLVEKLVPRSGARRPSLANPVVMPLHPPEPRTTDPDARRPEAGSVGTMPLRDAYVPEEDRTLPPEDRTLPPDLFDSEPTRIKRSAPPAVQLQDVEDNFEPTALDPGAVARARAAAASRARSMSDPSITVQDQQEPRRAGRTPLLVGLLLVLGLGVLGAALWMRLGATHGPRAGATVTDAPERHLVVSANAPRAEVFVGARLLGATPLDVDNDFEVGKRVTLTVRAAGFAEVSAEFEGGKGQRVDVVLAPAPE